MTYDAERLKLKRLYLVMEWKHLWVVIIRTIPSFLFWIGFVLWLFNISF